MTDSDHMIATVTLSRDLPNRRRILATAELHHLAGNARPYFSVTMELHNLRCREDSPNRVESAGAAHEEILRYFPQLAPVVALHLADDRGVPMYAVANGAYWLGLTDPRYLPDGAPRLDHFASLWRITPGQAQEFYEQVRAVKPAEAADDLTEDQRQRQAWAKALSDLAAAQGERWQREANDALALIRNLAKEGG
jgi:hypothetical protein